MLEEIINSLEENITSSLTATNLNNIFNHLAAITKPSLICGVGGSNVVSNFLEKILNQKNNIIVQNISIEDFFLKNISSYHNLILVSYSGQNHGIKSLTNSNLNTYLLTNRKTKISNENLLTYTITNHHKSFISLDDTIIPLSILLCYYLNTYKLNFKIPKLDNLSLTPFTNLNIIYDESSKTCATFLETTFIESGTSSVTLHTKYSLCHGRTNIISNQNSLVIYLNTQNTELDQLLISELHLISSNFLLLETKEKDLIIADYILVLKSLSLLSYLNKTYNYEFVNVKYNKIVPTIYNYKGELI